MVKLSLMHSQLPQLINGFNLVIAFYMPSSACFLIFTAQIFPFKIPPPPFPHSPQIFLFFPKSPLSLFPFPTDTSPLPFHWTQIFLFFVSIWTCFLSICLFSPAYIELKICLIYVWLFLSSVQEEEEWLNTYRVKFSRGKKYLLFSWLETLLGVQD